MQAKGTKGAKLALKRLSGREKRHQRAVNHVISRRIIDTAKATGRGVAIEELTGIRERTTVRKDQRYKQHSWSFWQLRSFLEYKAIDAGVPLFAVDPRSTSQTCHRCSERGHRDALIFTCTTCGSMDSDLNGARNIAARGAKVTSPELAKGPRMDKKTFSEKAIGL
jgi:IS605 OrfB family transposase